MSDSGDDVVHRNDIATRSDCADGDSSFREALREAPWIFILAGWIFAYTAGLAFGVGSYLMDWMERGADWEREVLIWANSTVSPYLDPLFLWLPYMGTNYTLIPFVVVIAILLWRRGYATPALHISVAQLGSWTLNPVLKFTFMRPRPDLFEHRGQYGLPAYPSGHSIAVVTVYFTAAYLIDRMGYGKWGYAVAAVLFVLNSYSRIYNGVHWPTDVIGGTATGIVWLAFSLAAFRAMHSRRVAAGAYGGARDDGGGPDGGE